MAFITARIDRITELTPQYRSQAPPVPRSVKIDSSVFHLLFEPTAELSRYRKAVGHSF